MAFMTRYRKLSAKDVISQEEVEYNYGRAFHGIGESSRGLGSTEV
jgi:general transcription factor 3C polypeptide 3 (transcription factor C subunit 4)